MIRFGISDFGLRKKDGKMKSTGKGQIGGSGDGERGRGGYWGMG